MSGGFNLIDVLNSEARVASITVGTTPIELKVNDTPLEYREMLIIQALDNNIYISFENSTNTDKAYILYKYQFLFLPVGEFISVYAFSTSGTKKLVLTELA